MTVPIRICVLLAFVSAFAPRAAAQVADQAAATPPAGRPCDAAAARAVEASGLIPDTSLYYDNPLVRLVSGTPLRYPETQQAIGLEGRVMSTFVLDTFGRVIIGTAVIISETDRDFGNELCRFLRRARYEPLVFNGTIRSIRVLESRSVFMRP